MTVECPPAESCGQIFAMRVGERASEGADRSAEFSVMGGADRVVVTVREAGEDVTSVTLEPDWVRVGGSKECGGPMEGEVVVPAP